MLPTKSSEALPLLKREVAPPPTKSLALHYFELTRLHKFPLGSELVFLPCAWGLTMAAYDVSTPARDLVVQIAMFAIGSTLLHSAACVINDICDRDFDALVERTKNRPLVTGALPISGAFALLASLTLASLSMLLFSNPLAGLVGLIGVFPLHALYPLMKRWTYWPQAWLGLAMNWGLPVAWISLTGSIRWNVVPIFFVGAACWSIVYDTIYACQDRADDVKAGVKSTALLFGDWVKPILMVFATVFIACMITAGINNDQGLGFFVVSVGGTVIHFAWQFTTWRVEEPADGGAKFKSNGTLGYVIWLGLLIDYYVKVIA